MAWLVKQWMAEEILTNQKPTRWSILIFFCSLSLVLCFVIISATKIKKQDTVKSGISYNIKCLIQKPSPDNSWRLVDIRAKVHTRLHQSNSCTASLLTLLEKKFLDFIKHPDPNFRNRCELQASQLLHTAKEWHERKCKKHDFKIIWQMSYQNQLPLLTHPSLLTGKSSASFRSLMITLFSMGL